MGILDMLDEASMETEIIENHPVKLLTLEEQILYLQGLSLVMNASDEIVTEQKDYLLLLIRSFALGSSIIDEIINFCQQPDKETIVSFFNTFKIHKNKHNFLLDTFVMVSRLNEGQEKSEFIQCQAMDKIAKSLNITETEVDSIESLMKDVFSGDSKALSIQLNRGVLDTKQFEYLAVFYDLEINLLGNDNDNDIEKSAELGWEAMELKKSENSKAIGISKISSILDMLY